MQKYSVKPTFNKSPFNLGKSRNVIPIPETFRLGQFKVRDLMDSLYQGSLLAALLSLHGAINVPFERQQHEQGRKY
jgi:hypothetical protein